MHTGDTIDIRCQRFCAVGSCPFGCHHTIQRSSRHTRLFSGGVRLAPSNVVLDDLLDSAIVEPTRNAYPFFSQSCNRRPSNRWEVSLASKMSGKGWSAVLFQLAMPFS